MSDQPLTGIRVVEIATGEAAALATRTMAGYGADVIKIEPPQGDPTRRVGPFPAGHAGPSTGAAFHYFHTGKRSVVLDLALEGAQQLLRALLAKAQVLVTDVPVDQREHLGLGKGELRDANRALSVVSVTPYGETGPYAGWAASELTEFAVGGQMSLMGDADREPLKAFHNQAECQASFHVLGAALAAIIAGSRDGEGKYVEISVQEIQASAMEAQGPMAYNGDPLMRAFIRNGNGNRATWGQYPCKDGYVGTFVNAPNLPSFFRTIGHPEWLERAGDQEFMQGECRKVVEEWCAARTRQEVLEAAIEFGSPFSFVAEPADILTSPAVSRTGIWRTVPHPTVGFVKVPGPPFRSDAMAFELSEAPALGRHTAEVLDGVAGVSGHDAALVAGQSGSSGKHGVSRRFDSSVS